MPRSAESAGEMSGDVPLGTRFATVEETLSSRYLTLVAKLNQITVDYQLPDHSALNAVRFPWSEGHLGTPALYASRMWEYPYALLAAELEPGMRCADIGCGMTAFPIFLKNEAGCEVTGVDPDLFDKGMVYLGHGVNREFIAKTNLDIVQARMQRLPLETDSFDRVFCLSVIEHLPPELIRKGVQEMARTVKPGGRLILTVDVCMHQAACQPLDLIWESGLLPVGAFDLQWPERRFGMLDPERGPLDVLGIVLEKVEGQVATEYAGTGQMPPPLVSHYQIPTLKYAPNHGGKQPSLLRRAVGRLVRAGKTLLHG